MGEYEKRPLLLPEQPLVRNNETRQVYERVCSTKGRLQIRLLPALRVRLQVMVELAKCHLLRHKQYDLAVLFVGFAQQTAEFDEKPCGVDVRNSL